MNKTLSVLGSTGSIGRQTLDVAEALGLKVEALTANSDVKRMEEQARKFNPRMVAMADETAAEDLAVRLADTKIRVAGGAAALTEAATMGGTVVTAVVGVAGLKPTLAAIRAGKRIALANKETLVCAGELVMETAQKYGAEIVPVDSEHSAIFQCLQTVRDMSEVRRLILTCSDGPFYGKTWDEMAPLTSADALKHPNWRMGAKITIDCATLMNKGLEVIEAMRLYRLPLEKVHVVIHRQSIIHSMVEFRDGAVLAQMGAPDMRLPIQYALTYPRRVEGPADPLDLLTCPPLTFAQPDRSKFPCLLLAEEAVRTGGTACAVLNAANEEAVGLYLRDRIGFYDIPRLVSRAMETIPVVQHPTLQDILDADDAARRQVF